MPTATNRYRIAAACGIALIVVVISGEVAVSLQQVVIIDRQILGWCAASRTGARDQFFMLVSWAGSSFFLLPLILAQSVMFLLRKHAREALFVTCSCVGAGALNHAMKQLIARPRPDLFPAVIDMPSGFSFPSSHAVQITACVLTQLLLLKLPTQVRYVSTSHGIAGLLILVVCFSRVYLQVHYPSDVAAGFLTALFWVTGLAALMLPDDQLRSTRVTGWMFEKGTHV